MILLLQDGLDNAAREKVVAQVRAWAARHGAQVKPPRGVEEQWDRCMEVQLSPFLQAPGEQSVPDQAQVKRDQMQALLDQVLAIDGVARATTATEPLFGVQQAQARLTMKDARLGQGDFSLLAGPCSVEDHDSLLALAQRLRQAGVTVLRGGAFKPRTSPYAFTGRHRAGLESLAEVSRQTGLAVVTEVLDPRHIELVSEHADLLQIGSRNMANSVLLREAGASAKPILLKRGMSATLSEFLLAAECLADAGADQIVLCERGLRHFDPEFRNLLDLAGVALLKSRCHLPVVVDPSHGTGRADLVGPMMVAAAAAGADGVLVEVHQDPAQSVSDAAQAIDPAAFAVHVQQVQAVLQATGRKLVLPAAEFPIPVPN